MPAMPPSPTWLFDLDNTLHDASPHIFPHINRSMRTYIEQHLGLDRAAANHLRQDYWTRYGATLLGLIRHHDIDPEHFLWETHQFPDLKRMLAFHRPTLNALRRLPGRKLIFSNAPRHYAEAILSLTGLAPIFDAVYTIECTRFQPKPSLAGFRALLTAERLDPRYCIMVEDTLDNLRPAKRLGMKTVWVSASSRSAPFVDVKVRHVTALPARCGRL